MTNIKDAAKKVPLMFRAQIAGRCQLQRIQKDVPEQDIKLWTSQWIEKAYPDSPNFGTDVQTRNYQINWRFVTNGGQDDGIIRPVIGARGWPFYPGSSMKGIFRRACTPEQIQRYCSRDLGNGDYAPGILHFHGGYPTDTRWQKKLVDIVHPQQDWQVKSNKSSSAFALISLHKPELKFGISSILPLEETEWKTIWEIWEKALSTGIGCRVNTGYGQPRKNTGNILYATELKGQGIAPKLLDGEGEFRPNIFKATIRGHALRIFGGLTEEKTAENQVEKLFGGIQGEKEGTFGLLAMTFRDRELEIDEFGSGNWAVPTYEVEGRLSWLLTQSLSDEKRAALQKLIQALTRFAMVFGGFGKSWRRADHRLFFSEYYDGNRPKPLIGCQWEWIGDRAFKEDVSVRKLEQVGEFIDRVRQTAKTWLQLQDVNLQSQKYASNWREAWHPDKVQVWGRLTEKGNQDEEPSKAIFWLHQPYRIGEKQGSIYKTSLTGKMGQIGRLWHRMYPFVRLVKDPDRPGQSKIVTTKQYLEILTIFPDRDPNTNKFLNFLNPDQDLFQKLW